jgi:hypothetical protein
VGLLGYIAVSFFRKGGQIGYIPQSAFPFLERLPVVGERAFVKARKQGNRGSSQNRHTGFMAEKQSRNLADSGFMTHGFGELDCQRVEGDQVC